MNILVTGAGGFLGRYIAEKLVQRGYQVFNFSRSFYPELEREGIHCRQGDLANDKQVAEALKDIDAVFHTAAYVKQWGSWDCYYRNNYLGTKNLLKAAREKGIRKFIFTSSPSVIYGTDELCGVDESQRYPDHYLSLYAKSKALAEKAVLEANDNKDFLTVSLRPHLVFGPRDLQLVPEIVRAAKQKRLVTIGKGDNLVDVIYVENAADAHLLALDRLEPASPICGKAYFLGQERPVPLWEFVNSQILATYNVSPITKKIPQWLAYGIASSIELAYKTLGIYSKEPPITRFLVKQLATSHYFNQEAAQRDLGYFPKVSIEEGVSRLKDWLEKEETSNPTLKLQ